MMDCCCGSLEFYPRDCRITHVIPCSLNRHLFFFCKAVVTAVSDNVGYYVGDGRAISQTRWRDICEGIQERLFTHAGVDSNPLTYVLHVREVRTPPLVAGCRCGCCYCRCCCLISGVVAWFFLVVRLPYSLVGRESLI